MMKLKYMDREQLRAGIMEFADANVALAMSVAEFAHEGVERHTLRPGTEVKDLYVMHPYRNALRARRIGADNDVVAICILHDTIEDAPDKIQEFFCSWDSPVDIYSRFLNNRIAAGVDGLTVNKGDNYNTHVIENVTANPDVLQGKIMDLKDNAGSLNYTRDSKKRVKLAGKYNDTVTDIRVIVENLEAKGPDAYGEDYYTGIKNSLTGLGTLIRETENVVHSILK